QVLSIVEEATQQNSFSWPLYVHLSGTTHPGATPETSQSVAVTARAYQRSTGSPWLAGFHSEVHHGYNDVTKTTVPTQGTSIMFNGELSRFSSSGRTIGMNLQAHDGTTYLNEAINLQSASPTVYWANGLHFEGPYNVGINFDEATSNMGIELRANSMRMDPGQKIYLDGYRSQAWISFNPGTQKVEIFRDVILRASF